MHNFRRRYKRTKGIPSFSGQDAPETKSYQHNAFAVYGHKPASLFALPVAIPGVASLRSSAKGSKSAPPYMKSVSAKSLKSLSPTGMKASNNPPSPRPHPLLCFSFTREHWWGAPTPLEGGSAYPHECPLAVDSKLPLPRYADVRLHIPMTHNDDSPRNVI